MLNCKHCNGNRVIKHGLRKTMNGKVQIYLCRDCSRVFSTNAIPYMNTRSAIVLRGISFYNQGYSLGQSVQMLEKAFGEKVPRNTLHYWTNNYSDLFTYLLVRNRNEPRLPLVPKIYPKFTFSIHRTKVSRMPRELSSLSDYLFRATKGIDLRKMAGTPLKEPVGGITQELLEKRCFSMDRPESRIARIAEEGGETDPLRSVLINDSDSLCRNLPLYMADKSGTVHSGSLDLLQLSEGKVVLLTYAKERIDDPDTLRHLIGCGLALLQRTSVRTDEIRIGAFDKDTKWLLDLPIKTKRIRISPKNN